MGSIFPELNERIREFIAEQKMFFVASAPLCLTGTSMSLPRASTACEFWGR